MGSRAAAYACGHTLQSWRGTAKEFSATAAAAAAWDVCIFLCVSNSRYKLSLLGQAKWIL
jgi:hypothetical protein